ncbi:MAG: hypothetical protein H6667_01020 [Ardenticatenaceae bacterium]|nr:hypothetical protein [Ardenticatenaceae bacterium]
MLLAENLLTSQPWPPHYKAAKSETAGLDVYSSEPPTNNPLIHLPNVVHTPHLGASSVEARRNVYK